MGNIFQAAKVILSRKSNIILGEGNPKTVSFKVSINTFSQKYYNYIKFIDSKFNTNSKHFTKIEEIFIEMKNNPMFVITLQGHLEQYFIKPELSLNNHILKNKLELLRKLVFHYLNRKL